MKAGTIAIVGICLAAAAGVGYYLYKRKQVAGPKKPVTKADILAVLNESDKELFQSILDKMSQQELDDTFLIISKEADILSGKVKVDDIYKANPGLDKRIDEISKKYNIFT